MQRPNSFRNLARPGLAAAAIAALIAAGCGERDADSSARAEADRTDVISEAVEVSAPPPIEAPDETHAPSEVLSPRPELPGPPLVVRYHLGELAPPPDWDTLEVYQETISESEFRYLLEDVFSEGEAWRATLRFGDGFVDIRRATGDPRVGAFRLRFAENEQPPDLPPERFWRSPRELPPAADLAANPLADVEIALDPGHIGGRWARVEERWYQLDDGMPVTEGDMTLRTAQLLAPLLENLGATVTLVRDEPEPVTAKRPHDFEEVAREYLRSIGIEPDDPEPGSRAAVLARKHAERLFYRTDEIRVRGDLINKQIQPDVVICLHFNAEAWGDPGRPSLVEKNHLHVLVNGTYSAGELALDDQRFDMMQRLLQRTHRIETSLSETVAGSVAAATALPPFTYLGSNAQRVSPSPYVWARNLLANRVYHCPVVFLEPYVMNSREVYERVQAGDYEGEREVAGAIRPSIYREYADSVARGVAEWFREARAAASDPPPVPAASGE